MDYRDIELKKALHTHLAVMSYRDMAYTNMMQQMNSEVANILKDDMGSQFIQNCGRDIAGEIVRNFFDTSSYYITVDQLATRILKFNYDNEYDPLADNGGIGEVRKSVYNYNELTSSTLDKISSDMDASQVQLFPEARSNDRLDANGKREYRENMRRENGTLYDELTGREGTQTTIIQNGKEVTKSNLHADHIQSRESARYNSKYITEDGVQALKEFWNSPDNMQMMHASANTSKGDVRVCEVNGKVIYSGGAEWRNMPDETDSSGKPTGNKIDKNGNVVKDISHRATAKQIADATIQQWEKGNADSAKIQKLIDEGYLQKDQDGNITVPKSVRKALEHNIRHSQNKESAVILKHTNYGNVAKDAAVHTAASIGKIIAGQIIYYAAPPLVYEIRILLSDKTKKLDSVLSQLKDAAIRIGDYVVSKLKDIFKNVLFNSLKTFVKSFMDILINAVKATIKKLLKIAKNLALATVDAIRIIADKNATAAEKADSVFNLFGVTITSCVVELLFELAADALHIPEPFDDIVFGPLQILTTVVCTNLTMLILQKADLFDVRFGFKLANIRKLFEEERNSFTQEMADAESYADAQITEMINAAKEESRSIYYALMELDPRKESVHGQLEGISRMFSINIDFDAEWMKFIGMEQLPSISNTSM